MWDTMQANAEQLVTRVWDLDFCKEQLKDLTKRFADQIYDDLDQDEDLTEEERDKEHERLLECVEKGLKVSGERTIMDARKQIGEHLAMRIVYCDLRDDLFTKMYIPTTHEFALRDILETLRGKGAILSILLSLPPLERNWVVFLFLRNMVHVWLFILLTYVSTGRVFDGEEALCLQTDGEDLRDTVYDMQDDTGSTLQISVRFFYVSKFHLFKV